MAAFGFVLCTNESFDRLDFDDEAQHAEDVAKPAAENVISIDEFRACVERTFGPAEPKDEPATVSATDATDDDASPASKAPTSENFEAEAEAGHSFACGPMPDPRDTPTPDGKHFWHLGLALYYVRQGVKIMPLTTGGTPVMKGCYEQLIDSEEAARDYWTKHPYCLIGIPAGANNLVIVDTDSVDHSEASADGVAEFENYTAKHGGIPETPQTITGTGGLHTFFKYASGIRFKNSVGSFLPSNDVRAMNGYVVAQGVVKPNGKRNTVAPGTIPFAEGFARGLVADLPQYLIDDLPKKDHGHHGDDYQDARHGGGEQTAPAMDGSRPSKSKPTHREIEYAKAVFDGVIKDLEATRSNRNDSLNNAAIRLGHYVASGHLTHNEVSNALYEASRVNSYLRKDGPTFVKNTIKSGLTAGMREKARPPKDRPRDGASNSKRKYASSKHESTDDMRQHHRESHPDTAREWLALHKLAQLKNVSLRRAGTEWLFAGYTVFGDDKGFIEFAAPMTPDECIDHLASALPGLFNRAEVDAFKRGDYDGGRRDGGAEQDAKTDDQLWHEYIKPTPYSWRDPSSIPPRDWLYGRHYIRKFVGATVAPPGVGKSQLIFAEAASMVSGRALLLGIAPVEPLNVWIWNGEDPIEELDRRISATMKRYDIKHEDCRGQLFIDSGRNTKIVTAIQEKGGITIMRPVFDAIMSRVKENKIDVLIIDPFIKSHKVSENDNPAIDAIAGEWADIAEHAGCAVELVHHVRKTGGAEVTVEAARGASSLIGAARSARALNQMTEEESRKAGVDTHRTFFRVGNGKANMFLPSEKSTWFRMESVNLQNGGTDDEGDSVGVVVNWRWPNPLDDATVKDLNEVIRRVGEGIWRANSQAKNWVGNIVADVMGFDIKDPHARETIKGLLRVWIANGALCVVSRRDESKRKDFEYVVVGSDTNDSKSENEAARQARDNEDDGDDDSAPF